jgi:hypothetical protein
LSKNCQKIVFKVRRSDRRPLNLAVARLQFLPFRHQCSSAYITEGSRNALCATPQSPEGNDAEHVWLKHLLTIAAPDATPKMIPPTLGPPRDTEAAKAMAIQCMQVSFGPGKLVLRCKSVVWADAIVSAKKTETFRNLLESRIADAERTISAALKETKAYAGRQADSADQAANEYEGQAALHRADAARDKLKVLKQAVQRLQPGT